MSTIPTGTPKRIYFPIKNDDETTLLEGQHGVKSSDAGSRAWYRPYRLSALDPVPDPILFAIDTTVQNAIGEVPTGLVNGVNKVYTTTQTIEHQDTTIITLDGVKQTPGVDYTTSGTTITFITAPATSSEIFAVYGLVLTGGIAIPTPIVVSAATYQVDTAGKQLVVVQVDYTATGACAIELSSALITQAGVEVIIKDSGATAGTNNITITTEGAETIDGDSAGAKIVADRGFVRLMMMTGTDVQIVGVS